MPDQAHYQVISRKRLSNLQEIELARFSARTTQSATLLERAGNSMVKGVPMSWMHGLYRHPSLFVESGAGSTFRDVDGNSYIDFNVVDLAMTMGFSNPHINAAVSRAMDKGAHFLLPVTEAIEVSEELAARTGMPFWQFTLSASGANTEVVRIARAITGRNKVLVFDGHYHGHLDDTLVEKTGGKVRPDGLGLPKGVELNAEIVPFNDLSATEATLKKGEVAVVITEPALSNCTLVKPDPGFLSGLYDLAHQYGSLLCLDEAHNFSFAYGGLKRAWNLPCDFLVLGKGLGTGVSFGLYGLTEELAAFVDAHTAEDLGDPGIAAGGTTYASTLAVFAAKAHRSIDIDLISARRLFMANRGIWDAMATAGPQVSFVHTETEVDLYLGLAREFLNAIRR